MEILISKAKPLVIDVLKAGLVPYLSSSPGVGKSAIVHQIAEDNLLKLIDIRLSQTDPVDLQGYPAPVGDKIRYKPIDLFPLETDPLPEGYKGWLILLDELSAALPAVQVAAYKLILDKMVGPYHLHKKVAIVAAGNKLTDKAVAYRLNTAIESRLIHFDIVTDINSWIQWADSNNIDFRIKSFLQFKPDLLHNFDPSHNDRTFPCPRTWEFMSKLISGMETLSVDKLPLLAGTIGEGAGREFFGYTQIFQHLPNIDQIKKNPESITIPDDPSIQYALTGLISYHLSEKNIEQLIKFLARLNIDFQVITLRSAIARNREIKNTKAVQEWLRHNAREMLAFDG